MLVIGLTVPGVAAAELPPCPNDQEGVSTDVPRYLRTGSSLSYSVTADEYTEVSSVVVIYTYTTASGKTTSQETLAMNPNESEVDVIRAIPAHAKALTLRIQWNQDEGTAAACAGSDEYREIPVVAAHAKVGRIGYARFAGAYRIHWTSKHFDGKRRGRWVLRATCDVFGCAARLRSSLGLKGTFRPISARKYRMTRRYRTGDCKFQYTDGGASDHTVFEYDTWTVTAQKVRDGRITRFAVAHSWYFDAPSDTLGLCDVPHGGSDRALGRG